jgi:hypothetical protein
MEKPTQGILESSSSNMVLLFTKSVALIRRIQVLTLKSAKPFGLCPQKNSIDYKETTPLTRALLFPEKEPKALSCFAESGFLPKKSAKPFQTLPSNKQSLLRFQKVYSW